MSHSDRHTQTSGSDTLSEAYPPHLDAPLDLDGDRLREECGVFGIFGHPEAAAITALGLHALQHRGQEAAGIVAFDGKRFSSERRLGLVGDHFSSRGVIERLPRGWDYVWLGAIGPVEAYGLQALADGCAAAGLVEA
jgi:amidophosphoribosyltransferase